MIPLADILIAFKWLAAIYLCSFVGVFLFVNKSNLSVLRYLFGKAAGVIMVAGSIWMLSVLKIIPFTWMGVTLVTLIFYAVVVAFRYKKIIESFKANYKKYLLLETVFIGLFTAAIVIRSSIPKIEGVEKYMDVAILSNLLRHTKGVPVDTWYAPESINYYYFGQWIVATIAKISSTTAGYAFNLGFATFLAITGTTIFGLAWQLSKKIIGGLLALFFALFAANLHPFIMTISGTHNYFFFNSGRFVEQIINEYPFYSVMLGDLHAHMLSLILTSTLYLAIVLIILESKLNNKLFLIFSAGILTGLMAATNSFDVITGFLLVGLTLFWLLWRKQIDLRQTVVLAGVYLSAFAVLLGFFMLHFKAAVSGLAIALFKVPMLHVFWQFGIFLLLIAASIFLLTKKPIAKKFNQSVGICLLFALAGIALVFIPEFILFKDIYFYQNPAFASANTVFKLWYAAWPLLGISSAVLAVIAINSIKNKTDRIIIFSLTIACVFVAAFGSCIGIKTLKDSHSNSLNGLVYLKYDDKHKLDIIEWTNKNITGQPIVLQAPGESYSLQSWFSSYSGLPSVIGWRSHEWGWRWSPVEWGQIEARTNIIKDIYESNDASQLKKRAESQKINYILIGPDEESVYAINYTLFTKAFGPPVYQNAQYTLYRVK